jgi:hypothetical protein
METLSLYVIVTVVKGTAMRLTRWILAVTVLAAGVVAAGAEPHNVRAALEGEERVNLDYQIYFGGLNVIRVGIELGLGPNGYEVEARTETVGLTGYLAPWRSTAFTRGEIEGGRVEPLQHRVDAEWRGKLRTIAIDFVNGEVADLYLDPPMSNPHDEVPPALRRGAVDPASALLTLVRVMGEGKGCGGRFPVFDGRRRYDVVVVEHGPETLAPNNYSAFEGQAVRCDFHVEPLVVNAPGHRRRFRSGRAWFAELFPGRPVVPVRLEVDGDYVQTLVHLSEQPRATASR